jgi:hypothetical protein
MRTRRAGVQQRDRPAALCGLLGGPPASRFRPIASAVSESMGGLRWCAKQPPPERPDGAGALRHGPADPNHYQAAAWIGGAPA